MILEQQSDDAPDAIFPDWFTTYKGDIIPKGVLIIHPMFYESRRKERDPTLIAKIAKGYEHLIDLTHFENDNMALEGKGAIVHDHRNRCFYIAKSNRAHVPVIDYLVEKWNAICVDGDTKPYKAITFDAKDRHGDVIYHTDCLMTVHEKHAFVCISAIPDLDQRAAIVNSLTTGPNAIEILELSLEQIEHMSANA